MAASIVGTPSVIDDGGSYTFESGSDRLGVISLANRTSNVGISITPTVTALTIGGSTASLANGKIFSIIETAAGLGANWRAGLWGIKEADIPGGSNVVDVTWSDTMQSTTKICMYTLAGVYQTVPVDTTIEKVQSSATVWQQAITVIADSVHLSAAVWGASGVSATSDAGYTERMDASNGSAVRAHSQSRVVTTEGSYTWGITLSSALSGRIAIASFAPVPAAGGGNAPRAAYMFMMG